MKSRLPGLCNKIFGPCSILRGKKWVVLMFKHARCPKHPINIIIKITKEATFFLPLQYLFKNLTGFTCKIATSIQVFEKSKKSIYYCHTYNIAHIDHNIFK